MNKKAQTEIVVLLMIAAIAIIALVFLFKTISSGSGKAAIPIPFADWECSCRGWCRLPSPVYGNHVFSSAIRPTIDEAQQVCVAGLELQCGGFLGYYQMIKCEQYQVQAATWP